MVDFILSQVDSSTHPQSLYIKSTLILSSHLRLGIPRDILLALSRLVIRLPTRPTSPSYVIYIKYTIIFYERRKLNKIVFVFPPFCEIPELTPILPYSSKPHFTVMNVPPTPMEPFDKVGQFLPQANSLG